MSYGDPTTPGAHEWSLARRRGAAVLPAGRRARHHVLGHRERLPGGHLRGGRRPRDQALLTARGHRAGHQGVRPDARRPGRAGPVAQGDPGADRRLARRGSAPTTSTSTRSTASIRTPRSRRPWRRCTTSSRPARSATSARRRCTPGSSPSSSTPPTCGGWTRFVSMQNQYNLLRRQDEPRADGDVRRHGRRPGARTPRRARAASRARGASRACAPPSTRSSSPSTPRSTSPSSTPSSGSPRPAA